MKEHKGVFKVLGAMQNAYYRSDARRERFVSLCQKLDAHLRGPRHKAVSVFVMAGDKVLIQQRALGKYHTPGLWANTCCTHPEWQEEATHCATRRLDEELGIKGLDPSYRGQVEYRADVGDGLVEHEVVEVFLCETTEDLAINLNPSGDA